MLFFNIVITIRYAFLPAINHSLHAMLIQICSTGGDPLLLTPLLKCITHIIVLTSTVLVSRNVQEVAMNGCYGCYFFPHGGSQFHTFASSTLPCQAPLCQIAPLLPSVNNKIGGITFTAALIVVFFLASVAESFRIDL